jgi:RNA polymerase sigma factor (sigma-70 family)
MGEGQVTRQDTHWSQLEGYDRHAACLIAARTGDRSALDAIVADLTPLVWHVARGHGLERTRAEDVVQTVWLRLLRSLHSVSEPRALAQWLITTTRREASQGWPKREEALDEDTIGQLTTEDGIPEREVLLSERDRYIWEAFRQLSERCQLLLRLTVLAGRVDYRTVAAELAMPRGSIGPTRGRCLNNLRDMLKTRGGLP